MAPTRKLRFFLRSISVSMMPETSSSSSSTSSSRPSSSVSSSFDRLPRILRASTALLGHRHAAPAFSASSSSFIRVIVVVVPSTTAFLDPLRSLASSASSSRPSPRVLGLLDLVFDGRGGTSSGFAHRLGNPRAALLQQHFRLECEGAFRTFDRALLQIVKARRAAGADAFGAEIRFDQGRSLRGMFCSEAGGFATIAATCQSMRRSIALRSDCRSPIYRQSRLHANSRAALKPLLGRAQRPRLRARAAAPGDKSVSHRALILGALAVGETAIRGLLEADDVLHTAEAHAPPGRRM